LGLKNFTLFKYRPYDMTVSSARWASAAERHRCPVK
jgi:hypothetical protein